MTLYKNINFSLFFNFIGHEKKNFMNGSYIGVAMNSYTKHNILKFHQKYLNRKFDQDDVALFIVLARDYMPKNSIFRELGDFLAHPDQKDRGIVLSSFQPVIDFFENNVESFFLMEL